MMRPTYLKIRRLVDNDIKTSPRPISPILGVAFLLIPVLTGSWGYSGMLIWLPAVLLAVAWTAFAWWRAIRAFRASVIRGDRDYDRRLKYLLPGEYARTESATASRRRRRKRRRVKS
ncbi:hypothetical protein ABS767_13345 [Sphingomonas sp. ST-64]|uniref:Uncharacterized protein n=1 Tax=Sphingomonas plantiphila TaxID=3163295 RepID=A0ABW8YSB0_9SPHN